MKALHDAEARRAIREDLDTTLIVEAAAGTGKTSELVNRVLALVATGKARLEGVVAVTFTEKAAGEMKLRIREELERLRCDAGPDATVSERFERALRELETARLGTIHGFCAELLRERPVEAEVDPRFEVCPEDEERRLVDRAFEEWLRQALEDPPEGVRRVLRRGVLGEHPLQDLRAAASELVRHRDFRAPWTRPPLDRDAELDTALARLGQLAMLAQAAASPRDPLARELLQIGRVHEEIVRRETLTGVRDRDRLEVELSRLLAPRGPWRAEGRGQHYGPGLLRADVIGHRDEIRSALAALGRRLDADLAALLREELWPVVERYEALKAQTGMLDFLDLLLGARRLLSASPEVRRELRQRFTHVFVDEFQDTDPLQAEILLALSAEDDAVDGGTPPIAPGKLFVVGDPKQSIYRFRRADVTLYERIKRELAAQGARVVHLTTSFRSLPAIQQAINAGFSAAMQATGDGVQATYQPLTPWREPRPGQPAVIALPAPRPYSDYGNLTKGAIAESLPDAVASFVEFLVQDSGFVVDERGAEVPIAHRHVCLLFRQFRGFGGDITRGYVRGLEARRIPHVLVGGRSFHGREEVLAVRTALNAIEWPDDALSVFATLRGPLMSLADDALLDFSAHVGPLHPMAPLELDDLEGDRRAVGDALSLLRALHLGRNRRSVAETLADLLDATRAHAGLAIWPTGEQALSNVLRIADAARRFERRGATSFRGFVERLNDDAERDEAVQTPVLEEGTDGVRIMTVHAAKGLEFPVVILCDPTVAPVRGEPRSRMDTEHNLWAGRLAGCAPIELDQEREALLAREAAEEVRVAYVAATRARDMLVVPTVGDRRMEGWVDVLHPALYPARGHERQAEPAPACPRFGDDSVLEAPVRAQRRPDESIEPGLTVPERGEHRVVWWDPACLKLDQPAVGGLRQHELLKAGEGDGGQERHDRWRRRLQEAGERGQRPSYAARPITALSREGAEELTVTVHETAIDRSARPSGPRFGSLVHAVVADALGPEKVPTTAGARFHGRMLGATPDEVDAAIAAVEAALDHELLRRAARSKDCRLESGVSVALEDGTVAEGIVDLAFREGRGSDARWTVVDFKTDRDPGAEPAYARQVALYVRAISEATSMPAQGCLLAL